MPLSPPPSPDDPMLPADEFAGKVALVTGGGSGVGLAMAEGFARCGAKLAIVSRSMETLEAGASKLRELGAEVLAIALDVRRPEEIAAAFDRTERELGPVSVLANNAGVNFPVLSEKLSPNGWRAVTQIVLDGTFFCCQEFYRRCKSRGDGGVIINNIASYAWTGFPGDAHAAAAKAGAMNLTMTLATEWARDNIRVNSISLGTYSHPGVVVYDTGRPEGARGGTVPAGRGLRGQELGWTAAFLCSRYASWVTGLTLVIDGGDWLRRDLLKPPFIPMEERGNLWLD